MPRTKISEFSSTAGSNTDIDGINIAEGCSPSGINDAIRELMAQLKDFQAGTAGDSFNGPVGTTTAAAGAFTTLTTSSTVTHNGGTANGVAYLNGSKVLTTGSALSFDGSTLYNSGNISVGGNSGGNRYVALLNETSTYTGTLMLQAGGGSSAYGGAVVMYGHSHASYPGAVYIGSSSGTSTGIIFGAGGNAGPANSEQMRLTSTGLGIGTSSPAYKLDVNGVIHNNAAVFISQGIQGNSSGFTFSGAGSNYGRIYEAANDRWALGYSASYGGASTEVLNWNSSGNLGIGTSSPAAKLNVVTTGGKSTIAIGDTALSTYSQLLLYGGSGKYNWSIGAQYNVNNAFEITPSTTVGGTTFSTPAFVIDSSSNVGIGTSSPAYKLDVQTSAGRFQVQNYGAGSVLLYSNGALAYNAATTRHEWQVAGSSLMQLEASGNLCLGVTPSAWQSDYRVLQISTYGTFYGRIGTNEAGMLQNIYRDSAGNFKFLQNGYGASYSFLSGGGHAWYNWGNNVSGGAGAAATGTQAMTLTAAGLLGVGVTSPEQRIHLPNSSGIRLGDAGATPKADINYSSVGSEFLDIKVQGTTTGYGNIRFYTGGTPDERARITSGGDFGIGTTTIGSRVTIGDPGTGLSFTNAASGNFNLGLLAGTGSADAYVYQRANNPLIFGTNNTERARIDSSGNLGVGRTSIVGSSGSQTVEASGCLVAGGSLASHQTSRGVFEFNSDKTSIRSYGSTAGTGFIAFNTGGGGGSADTERARITSGGAWQVGTSGVYTEHATVQRAANEYTTTFVSPRATAAQNFGLQVTYSAADPNGTGNFFLYCEANGTIRANIRSNGGIANYSANNVNLSDRREKTNFAPAKSYIDAICAIPVQTFNYVDQNMEEDPGLTLGVVAQDVQAVAPELVMESNWAKEGEDPKMRLSIYQTDLQYALMKCIQEQQVMINELKAKVAALEAK